MALFFQIFTILFPVFIIVATGYVYARWRNTDMEVANRLNMEIFIPALLFSVMAKQQITLENAGALALGGALVMLGSTLLSWPVARSLGISVQTLLPPMMFKNSGNMGIPIALFTFGESILPAAIVLFIVSNLVHFSVGTTILSQQFNWRTLYSLPILPASVLGILFSISGINSPDWLLAPVDMLGQIAIPLMLFALGVRLTEIDFTHWKIGLLGAVLSPFTGGLVFLILYPWLPLSVEQMGLLLMFALLPPAIVNYILAEQYQQEPHKVASIVMLGNLFSLLSMPLALSLVLSGGLSPAA
ncbi:AEC family transporter [Candidatus Venteria ishoeyi]|uniref:AEC family transporter n=1 Tax=Candidatus Venteria ishoeyi TaxID=1899563 RepID=UPI0025A632CE|nr:AEC family transporter [Candidatus Venteria ishoeyi]MDM8546486.1 AEC family transporter [Candidatus Venteria ishoeyi]